MTLKEMGVALDKEFLRDMLKESVSGPDMEHIPYPVTEDMVWEAVCKVEAWWNSSDKSVHLQ